MVVHVFTWRFGRFSCRTPADHAHRIVTEVKRPSVHVRQRSDTKLERNAIRLTERVRRMTNFKGIANSCQDRGAVNEVLATVQREGGPSITKHAWHTISKVSYNVVFKRQSPHLDLSDFDVPYFDRALFRFTTPCRSSVPRTARYFTPGRSLTRPPVEKV